MPALPRAFIFAPVRDSSTASASRVAKHFRCSSRLHNPRDLQASLARTSETEVHGRAVDNILFRNRSPFQFGAALSKNAVECGLFASHLSLQCSTPNANHWSVCLFQRTRDGGNLAAPVPALQFCPCKSFPAACRCDAQSCLASRSLRRRQTWAQVRQASFPRQSRCCSS